MPDDPRARASRGPFGPYDRPRVEARHTDGHWYPGRLHGWVRADDAWRAVVTYGTTPGIQYYACLGAGAVREPEDDPDDGTDDVPAGAATPARDGAHADARDRGVSAAGPRVS